MRARVSNRTVVRQQEQSLRIEVHRLGAIERRMPIWERWFEQSGFRSLSLHPRWLLVLREAMKHEPICVEASADGQCRALLNLALIRSVLFGRHLVSLPYVNTGGVLAKDSSVAQVLISQAIQLADSMNVRHLQLRHELHQSHEGLKHELTTKAHMRLTLPSTAGELWDSFRPKVRNQVRKGQSNGIEVAWGGEDLLDDYYDVFARNMRDLGTPVYGRSLFAGMLSGFPDRAEICVGSLGNRPVAAAILLHGAGITEVPSASSLREFNSTNANMYMYWNLLQRAIERGNTVFDFGRSSVGSPTYRFKEQWGAKPEPAIWQFYVRKGSMDELRPESGKYRRAVRLWRCLPVSVTRLIGPSIVRGIP